MLTTSSDLSKKSLQIKENDKFYSRLLSKENSITNSNSSRVYYGVASAGSVPFMWESQPGTPKHTFSNTNLPPLTPPPSYYLNSKKNTITKKTSKSNLLDTLFPKLSLRKHNPSITPSLSSASSSSVSSLSTSSSAPPTPSNNNLKKRTRFSSSVSSFDSRLGDDTEDSGFGSSSSPTSIFGITSSKGHHNTSTSCYSMVFMKKALLSIVGSNGSGGRGGRSSTT